MRVSRRAASISAFIQRVRPAAQSQPLDLTPGRWVHVALVTDGERRSLWVDGVAQGSHQARGIPWGPGPVRLGGGLQGRLDEIAVFNRVLSEAEIRRLAAGCGGR